MSPRRGRARARTLIAAFLVLCVVAPAFPVGRAAAAAADDAVARGFDRVWSRTDDRTVRGDRTFIWGPEPLVPRVIMEPMAGLGLPGDMRPVLYWDKTRMEVNQPGGDSHDPYYVTHGLLVAEMVSGRQQIGVNPTRYAARSPAEIPFGDLDDPTGPTYRSFAARLADAPLAPGQPVAQGLDRAGQVGAVDAGGAICQVVVAETSHCIADPFWDFLNQAGPLFDSERRRVVSGPLFEPLFYATGLPISEPYWITVRAGGTPTRVLIQLFERRVLTYNPANGATNRVEMGNVGLHYYNWRYTALLPTAPPTGLDPAMRAAIGAIWDAAPAFRYLPRAVDSRYQLLFQDLTEDGVYGFASRRYHLLAVDGAYVDSPRGAGIILVHEMQHARDLNTLGDARNAQECYAAEARGFLTEAYLWQTWYGPAGKATTNDRLEREENVVLRRIRTDPKGFIARLIEVYTENGQCSVYRAGGVADRMLTTEGLPEGIAAALPVVEIFAALRVALADDAPPVPFDVEPTSGLDAVPR